MRCLTHTLGLIMRCCGSRHVLLHTCCGSHHAAGIIILSLMLFLLQSHIEEALGGFIIAESDVSDKIVALIPGEVLTTLRTAHCPSPCCAHGAVLHT